MHYKDNWQFNAKYYHNNLCLQFSSPPNVGDIKFILKLLFAKALSAALREIEFREINDIFIVIKKIEILTWLHFCPANA